MDPPPSEPAPPPADPPDSAAPPAAGDDVAVIAPEPPDRLKRAVQWLDGSQKLLTSIAIVAAGAWFFATGESLTRLETTLSIQHRKLGDEPWMLLTARVTLENVGRTTVAVDQVHARVQQALPLHPSVLKAMDSGDVPRTSNGAEVRWPPIDGRDFTMHRLHIRPGEQEHIDVDFVVSDKIQTVKVVVETREKSYWNDLVWRTSSFHDLAPSAKGATP